MATAEITETFDAPVEKVYKMLTDYESYPEYVDGTSDVTVKSMDENGGEVEFKINIIKKFSYSLKFSHEAPLSVSWEFIDGDLFSKNDGSWQLTDNGDGTTSASYKLDLEFKIKVPGMILKKLTGSNLPKMMDNYRDRLEELE